MNKLIVRKVGRLILDKTTIFGFKKNINHDEFSLVLSERVVA